MIALAVVSVVALAIALVSYLNSQGFAAQVDALDASGPCATDSADANCYQVRGITITSVAITQNKHSETATVRFLDADHPHEVSIDPFDSNSSTLRTGESGIAILWRGIYTQLDVGGATYVTTDNPVGQRDHYRFIAWLAALLGLALAAAIPVEVRLYRRRWGAPAQPQAGDPPPESERA